MQEHVDGAGHIKSQSREENTWSILICVGTVAMMNTTFYCILHIFIYNVKRSIYKSGVEVQMHHDSVFV